MRIGDVDVLVEARVAPDVEPTSAADRVQEGMAGAFERTKAAIVAIGMSTVEVMDRLRASTVAHPDEVEVEFGLAFSAKGKVIAAEASAESTLKIKLV